MTHEWLQAIAGYLEFLKAGAYPSSTISLRRYHLMRLASEVGAGPWLVTSLDLIRWLAGHEWATETRRSHRVSLVGFYGWAVRAGHVAADPMLAVPRVRPVHHLPRPAPEDALSEALSRCDERVGLMVRLAAFEGLRRGEIARVRGDDAARVPDGWDLVVHGKGNKDRVIPLDTGIAVRIRERGPSWTFPGQIDGHLSPARVGELVSAALPGDWTAHTLRHRFATKAYAGSHDLVAVQHLLGHAKPETTLTYVAAPTDAMRVALVAAA